MRIASLLCGLALVAPALVPSARAATCAVSDVHVPVRSLNFNPALNVSGLSFPVTFDEAAGTITFDFSSFGVKTFTLVGVDNDIRFTGSGVFTGTLDAGGNIALPVTGQFGTNYTTPETFINIAPRLSTGIATVTVSGSEFASEGVALDFTTGTLTLDGQAVVDIAPGLNISVTTGVRMTCTLDTIPDRTKLAAAAALKAGGGNARFEKGTKTPPQGDSIKRLTATLTVGATAPDPSGSDVFVALRGADGKDVALVHVAPGGLTAKGKTFQVTDTDGTSIVVVTGQKSVSGQAAALSGKMKVRVAKKKIVVALAENGLDLSGLASGTGSVAVAIGDQSATHPVTIHRGAKSLSFR